MDKWTVNLEDYIKYLLKKWKVVTAFVLIIMLLFMGSSKMLGERIVISPSEEYLTLKNEEEFIAGYIENAPLMKIDATCVHECTIYLSNISDSNKLKDYLDSGQIFAGYEYDFGIYQLVELASWEETCNLNSADIKVQHYDEESCKFMTTYLAEEIQKYDENIEVLIGTQHVTRDESITEDQQWYKERLNTIQGQLEYMRSGYVIEASVPLAAITGALFGVFASIIGVLVLFYIDEKKSLLRGQVKRN